MEKKFKLPKDFAVKWLEALRSGKYIQSRGMLTTALYVDTTPLSNELDKIGFCCLGVAGHLCGNPISSLSSGFLYSDKGGLVNVPKELLKTVGGNIEDFPMIHLLSKLNDGLANSSLIVGYNVRPDVSTKVDESLAGHKDYRFSFAEIADFIEDNTEFYEPEIQ
jgi:hypothetical protein